MTLLGVLNFLVLQWFGVRLGCAYDPGEIPGRKSAPITDDEVAAYGGRWWSRFAPPRGVRIRWVWMRWIWPLTGWWSPFRRIRVAGTPWRRRDITCECGKRFGSGSDAVAHAIAKDHRRVKGLLFSSRRKLEEHNHEQGVCTHEPFKFPDGARTICIADNPIAGRLR